MSLDFEPASPRFGAYRSTFPARAPDLARQLYNDEVKDLTGKSDFFSLSVAPQRPFITGEAPTAPKQDGVGKLLFLVATESVVLAPEHGTSGKSTERGRLAHTNLSGGQPAHAGGELWFRDETSFWMTWASSRYVARSAEERTALVDSFRQSGYHVCSCGWDDEVGEAARYFRGSEKWLAPI